MSISQNINRTFNDISEFANTLEGAILEEIQVQIQPLLSEINSLRNELTVSQQEIQNLRNSTEE
jgi:mevalonate kinase